MSERKNPLRPPWTTLGNRDVRSASGLCVATIPMGRAEEAQEAAHLIAASPVMHAALKMVAEYHMGDDDLPQEIADAINNALAKARGES